MNFMRLKYISICVVWAFFAAAANDIDSQQELQSLQKEIDRNEEQLQKKKKDEQAAANLIAGLDRKIDVTSNVLYSLRTQVDRDAREIEQLERDITLLEDQIMRLRSVIKKRLVSFYKYGRRRDFEMLLAGGSFQAVDIWLRYEKMIAQNDKRNFESLVSKKQQLQEDQERLQVVVKQREKALQKQQEHAGRLSQARSKRNAYLQTIRKDRRYIEHNLEELAQAQAQIKGIISKSERLRVEKQRQISNQNIVPKPSRDYSFKSMKGKLPWPTSGNVVSHFGRQRHPTLKTVTENLGIEIRAPLGTPVQSIDAGMVETITWQRGRGNIVIISHDDGYYTVYTHLAEIRVNVMDAIDAGEVIGTVGESGSLSGPVLHFQIWKNTENLNPEEWLS